jgi:N-methylhydantoinase A
MSYRMGIDIGGTFTDFALINDVSGAAHLEKVLTTPADPSIAVLQGMAKLLADARVPIGELASIIHGSTLVTNAVIERKGAVTAMLVTRGFRDVIDIALERRYDLYDLRLRFPDPLVPRALRIEVDERMREDGIALKAPDLEAVGRSLVELARRHQLRAVAICFLHSFTNDIHEREVARFVKARLPELYVSTSADVLPYMREYERWTTTTINAFVQPVVDRYLSRIEAGLAHLGARAAFYVMTSSGGTVSAEVARRYPVRMLESGPAAGVFMAAHHGKMLGIPNLLSFDMGGTTAKGAIIRDGVLHKKYELEVARVHEFKPGSGLPVRIPVVDMIEIGAGGGGIAEIDDRGVVRVGPRSAGADPGPACYGRGGDAATLTDANLALGFYDPAYFLGGSMRLDPDASTRVIRESVARPLNVDVARAAWGIHETINEDVARAFRVHASEIGFDYRKCGMVAFGGCGPAHAMRIARKLRIPRVVFPSGSGVMSAIGMLVSPISFQVARTHRVPLAQIDPARLAAYFRAMEEEARQVVIRAGTPPDQITVTRHLDMRYQGQGYEIEVPLPAADDPSTLHARLPALFAAAYERIFSLSYLEEPVEIIHWKVDLSGPAPRFDYRWSTRTAGASRAPEKGRRRAYFPEAGGFLDCPVLDRYALSAGVCIDGPAIIEERESTCILGLGDRARVDEFGNLVAEIGAQS